MTFVIFVIVYFIIAGVISFLLSKLKMELDRYMTVHDQGYKEYDAVIVCSVFWIVAAPIYAGYLYSRCLNAKLRK